MLGNPRRLRAALLASALACAVGALPAPARASETSWQVGSVVASLVYSPLKLAYATAGVVFGGIAWGLSGGNAEVRDAVIGPAVGGDYVVTPSHLRGERSLEFVAATGGAAEPEPYADDPYAADPYALEPPYGDDSYGY